MSAALKQPVQEGQFNTSSHAGFIPAGKGKRIIAFFLDTLISTALYKFITLFGQHYMFGPESPGMALGFLGLMMFLPLAYWVVFPLTLGATPGKIFMGLKIVQHEGHKEVTAGQMILRETLGRMAAGLVFALGYIMIYFDKDKRGWHDKIAKTWVVEQQ